MRLLLTIISLLAVTASTMAQSTADSTSRLLSRADEAIYTISDTGQEYDSLLGNVIIVQDSIYISCDQAYITDQIMARAIGSVVIVSDSTTLYAHRGYYSGLTQVALLAGEVIMESGDRRLYTDSLRYDTDSRYAEYRDGGTIIDPASQLVSREGDYDLSTGIAHFRHNVQYQDTSLSMWTDSIRLDYGLQRIHIIAPTRISADSTEIYCESGIYSIYHRQGVLSDNVQIRTSDRYITAGLLEYDANLRHYQLYLDPIVQDSTSIARGDSIIYDEQSGLISILGDARYTSDERSIKASQIYYDTHSETFKTVGVDELVDDGRMIQADLVDQPDEHITEVSGGVMLSDTARGVSLWTDYMTMDARTDLAVTYGDSVQPLLEYTSGGDTLLILADTLLMRSTDTSEAYMAQRNVRLSSDQMTGQCDSLHYALSDSVIILIGQPILWMDSTQLTADTIYLHMADSRISSIRLAQSAIIATMSKGDGYDQISGNHITGDIYAGQIQTADVVQNAQMIYHVLDENHQLQGVSSTKAVSMHFDFDQGGEISSINYEKPESVYHSVLSNTLTDVQTVPGFVWKMDDRPSIDIFTQRKK